MEISQKGIPTKGKYVQIFHMIIFADFFLFYLAWKSFWMLAIKCCKFYRQKRRNRIMYNNNKLEEFMANMPTNWGLFIGCVVVNSGDGIQV